MAWIVDHVSLLVAVGGAILSVLGFMQIAELGRRLGVSPADLGADTSTYLVIAGTSVAFLGGFLVVLLLGSRIGRRVATWAFSLTNADFCVVLFASTGLAIVISVAVGLVSSWATSEIAYACYLLYVAGFTLLVGAMVGLMGSLVPRSALQRWVGWTVTAVLVIVGLTSTMDDEVAHLVDEARQAAMSGEPIVPSASLLSMVIRPSDGIVTLADGSRFCVCGSATASSSAQTQLTRRRRDGGVGRPAVRVNADRLLTVRSAPRPARRPPPRPGTAATPRSPP